MANIFLIRIGNALDSTSYSKIIIAPDHYTQKDIQSAIDCGDIVRDLDREFSNEFIIDINKAKADYCAFDEDDFKCIEDTLRDLHTI
jgi:nicotinamide mononucleotide adenylyltransferase